jgi:hypothetical protein
VIAPDEPPQASESTPDRSRADPDPRWLRWCRRALVAGGILVIGYAVSGALADPDSRLGGQLLFLAGVLVAHDAVLMPVVIGVGALVGRLVPVAARTAVRVAAFVSLCAVLVALPVVLGAGRPADDRSALPLPYGRNLTIVLLVGWAVALGVGSARIGRSRRRRRPRA